MKLSSRDIFVGIKEYILMTFGMFCYAFGWQMCVLPAGGMGGGAAGLATLINAILPASLSSGLFTIGNLIFIINCILLILGVMIVGWKFGIKTLYCILMMSVMFNLVDLLPQGSDILRFPADLCGMRLTDTPQLVVVANLEPLLIPSAGSPHRVEFLHTQCGVIIHGQGVDLLGN